MRPVEVKGVFLHLRLPRQPQVRVGDILPDEVVHRDVQSQLLDNIRLNLALPKGPVPAIAATT